MLCGHDRRTFGDNAFHRGDIIITTALQVTGTLEDAASASVRTFPASGSAGARDSRGREQPAAALAPSPWSLELSSDARNTESCPANVPSSANGSASRQPLREPLA